MLVAKIFKAVRRQVDDDKATARPQHARSFGDRDLGLVEKMQHLVDRHQIEVLPLERQIEDIGVAYRSRGDAGLVEIGACHTQHVAAGIDANCPAIAAGEKLQHAAGAGAEIEQGIDRIAAEQLDDGGIHLFISRMQAAKLVPFGSVTAEIGLRTLGAVAFDGGKTLAVPLYDRIVFGDMLQEVTHQRCGLALMRQPEIGPGALLIAIDELCLAEQLQVPRDAGLGLAQDFSKIGNGEITCRQQRQQPQARRFAGRLQDVHQRIQSKP